MLLPFSLRQFFSSTTLFAMRGRYQRGEVLGVQIFGFVGRDGKVLHQSRTVILTLEMEMLMPRATWILFRGVGGGDLVRGVAGEVSRPRVVAHRSLTASVGSLGSQARLARNLLPKNLLQRTGRDRKLQQGEVVALRVGLGDADAGREQQVTASTHLQSSSRRQQKETKACPSFPSTELGRVSPPAKQSSGHVHLLNAAVSACVAAGATEEGEVSGEGL